MYNGLRIISTTNRMKSRQDYVVKHDGSEQNVSIFLIFKEKQTCGEYIIPDKLICKKIKFKKIMLHIIQLYKQQM